MSGQRSRATGSRPPPKPPRPDNVRRLPREAARGGFGWLDDRLLRDRWLARLGPEATAVMVLLVLAADRNGVSYYRRETMVGILGMSRESVDRELARLLDMHLVAHRPWGPGQRDGVWQVLPMPHVAQRMSDAGADATSIGAIIARLHMSVTKSPSPDFCGS